MDLKKSISANLENKRTTNLIVGLIVSLTVVLAGFEWTSTADENRALPSHTVIDVNDIIMPVTRREEPRPEPKTELPKVMEVLNIVDDDVDLDEVNFDFEVTDKTAYDFFNDLDDEKEEVVEEVEIFYHAEEMPLFNGGNPETEFLKYVLRNLEYPEIAAENGVSGRVYIQFDINPTGTLANATVIRGVDPALDQEALRVVTSSPKWTPGKQRSKPVTVRYTFPINFVLQ